MKLTFFKFMYLVLCALSLISTKEVMADDLISTVHAYNFSLPNGKGSLINKINNHSNPYSVSFYWLDTRKKEQPQLVKTFSNFYHENNVFSLVIPAPSSNLFNQLLIVDSDGYSCNFPMQNDSSLSRGTCNGAEVFPYTPQGSIIGENPVKVGQQQSPVMLGNEITNVQQVSIGDLSREDFFGNHLEPSGLKSQLIKPQRTARTVTIKNLDPASSESIYIFGVDFGPEAINANNQNHLDNAELIKTVNNTVDNPNWLKNYGVVTLSQTLKVLPEYNKNIEYIWIKDAFNKKPYQAAILPSQKAFSLNVDDPLFKNLYYKHPNQKMAVFPFRVFAMYRIEKSKLNTTNCGRNMNQPCDESTGLTNIYTNKKGTEILGTQFEMTYFPNEVTEKGLIQNTSGELDNGTIYDTSYVDGMNVLITRMIPIADIKEQKLALGKTGGVIFGDPNNISSNNYRSTLYLIGNEVDSSPLSTQLEIVHSPDNSPEGFNVVVNNKNEVIGVASICTAANMDSKSSELEKSRACCKGSINIGGKTLDFTDPVVCTQHNWATAIDKNSYYNVFNNQFYISASNLIQDPIPSLPKVEITSGYTFAYADSTSTFVVPNRTQDIVFGFVTPTINNYGKKIIDR